MSPSETAVFARWLCSTSTVGFLLTVSLVLAPSAAAAPAPAAPAPAAPAPAAPAPAAPASAAPAIELDRTRTSGPAVSLGVGSQYPRVGAQVAYYVQLPGELARLTPYASVGALICPDCLGAAFGVMGSYGKHHRLVVDAFGGTVGSTWYSLHGEPRHYQAVWGVGLALGYEHLLREGFFVRSELGVVYGFGPPIVPPERRFGPAVTWLGVGYKLY